MKVRLPDLINSIHGSHSLFYFIFNVRTLTCPKMCRTLDEMTRDRTHVHPEAPFLEEAVEASVLSQDALGRLLQPPPRTLSSVLGSGFLSSLRCFRHTARTPDRNQLIQKGTVFVPTALNSSGRAGFKHRSISGSKNVTRM